MVHDVGRSDRDAALRTLLVQRAKADRTGARRRAGGAAEVRRRLPMVATAVVLLVVVALSAGAIAAGRSTTMAATEHAASGPPAAPADPVPSNSTAGSLIAMDGARSLTRAQLHAWTLANRGASTDAVIGEEQDRLIIQCMAEHGYLYDPTFEGSQGLELGRTWGLTTKQLQGYREALWGSNLTAPTRPYDWRDAGCDGRAVHLTGQDDHH